MAGIRIMVATPAFGDMFYSPYVQSLLRLQRALIQRRDTMHHMAISYASVGDARNALVTYFHDKSDATHILFVDADMGFETQLIFDMVELSKPVVGVIYTKRQIDLNRLVAAAAKGETPQRAIARAHDFIIRPLRGRAPRRLKGFMEVAACGTGIMLIERATIATMLKTLPEINDTGARKTSPLAAGLDRLIRAFDPITVDGAPLMDDFAFCHRWGVLCKGEIWARADKAVTHIGLHRFAASYTDAGGDPRIITQAVPLRVAPREARAKKERGDGAGKREEPEPATAAEVTLAFLRAQIDSPRWGKPYRAWLRRRGLSRRQLIDRADLSDAGQNAARVRLLGLATNNILNGLPAGTAWTRRMIAPAELGRLKYINADPWLSLSGRTRLVADGARNLDTVAAKDGRLDINAHVRAVMKALRTGQAFPELILVEGENGGLILLEGHARATAYVAAGITTPVAAFVGS
ncbi:MAG TPA: hypothetical protein VFA53_09000, partial [Xanthobacteraceae bacterium]|nr:hypothetical protein [Xanthobacteraceae bacterium]